MKIAWFGVYLGFLVWSAIDPKDSFIWFLEVLPALLGAVILVVSYKRFTLTPLLYFFILLHCIVLMIGGHYTYAEVPFFDGLFGAERNNYDKLGHFFQGFVPALIARELLIRKQVVTGQGWLGFIVVAIALAISAFYELIEWWVALASGEEATAFLGTQGYIWDTQSDMALALLGAILAITFLARLHDRQLKQLITRHKR